MSSSLFAYPRQTELNRVLPKNKIYAHAKPSKAVRDRFVKEVGHIVWSHKLAPETINLPARAGVPEIQIFRISLKADDLSETVLRAVDRAIPFPILFELTCADRVRCMAAYKRPSEADSSKWVIGEYFASPWSGSEQSREPLPIALDLGTLYEQMLRRLISIAPLPDESLKAHVERVHAIRALEKKYGKLQSRLQQEKQFNRKVEINRELRELADKLNRLQSSAEKTVGNNHE